jgi:DNA-binding NarL/FixJ family response regulator
MENKIAVRNRVIIADDHPVVRSGIIGELSYHEDIVVIAEATDGDTALFLAREYRPSMLLLDINMPGMKAVRVIKTVKSEDLCKVLVLSAYKDIGTVLAVIKSGADGYMLKDDSLKLIPEAIKTIIAGERWFSEELREKINQANNSGLNGMTGDQLSDREMDILIWLCHGLTNQQIAQKMQLTERTVEYHIKRVFDKAGVISRVEAAIWAKEHGIA